VSLVVLAVSALQTGEKVAGIGGMEGDPNGRILKGAFGRAESANGGERSGEDLAKGDKLGSALRVGSWQ